MGSRNLPALLLLCIAASAQANVDPTLFGDLHWRSIGPFPQRPRTDSRQACRAIRATITSAPSTAASGRPATPDEPGSRSSSSQPVGTIGAHCHRAIRHEGSSTPGSGGADMRSDIAQGDGVYKSTDSGRSWVHVGLRDTQQVGKILVHPDNADVVYVAALGHPYGPNAERGVFPLARRRQELAEGVVHGCQHRRHRPGVFSPAIQTSSTPRCGRRAGRLGTSIRRRTAPAAVYCKSTDGGDTWKQIPDTAFHRRRPRQTRRCRTPRRNASTQWSMATPAACIARMTAVQTGAREWRSAHLAARLVLRPDHGGSTNADRIYSMNTIVIAALGRRRRHLHSAQGRPPATISTPLWIDPGRQQPADPRFRPGRTGDVERRHDLELVAQPGDRADLPRQYGQPLSVLGLRCAAGFRRAEPAEPRSRLRRHQHDPVPRDHAGRRERQHRAGPEGSTISSSAVASTSSTCARRQPRHVDPTLAAEPDLYRATWTLPLVFSRRDPHMSVLRQPAHVPHRRRRRTLGSDQPGPDARESRCTGDARCAGAANNLGTGPRRGVDLCDRAIARGRHRHLGRHRRWPDLAHSR